MNLKSVQTWCLPFLNNLPPALILISLTFSGAGVAASGPLHFYGKIVEDGCSIISPDNAPQARCYRDGKWSSQPILMKAERPGKLPGNIGTTRLHWLDAGKTQAIMTISYH